MTRTLKQRLVFTLAITAFFLAAGAACGYLFGCLLAAQTSLNRMSELSLRVEDRAATMAQEVFTLLADANANHFTPCSPAELAFFHDRMFHAEYVRDIGRIQQGKILCSASTGKLDTPRDLPLADSIVSRAGNYSYLHYQNFPHFEDKIDYHATQLGNFYVVLGNFRYARLGPDIIGFVRVASLPDQDMNRQIWGRDLHLDLHRINHNNVFWNDGQLLVTRCMKDRSSSTMQSCTTTFLTGQAILGSNRPLTIFCTIIGVFIGLCFGLFCAMIFRRSLSMEKQLLRAIRKGELKLVYQPIVRLDSGQMVEVEALARWTDADGFAVSPAVFIPTAEQCGYIGELTAFVVRTALREMAPELRRCPQFRVNVNVTAYDLADENFLPMIEHALAASGVKAGNLAIEITESSTARVQTVRETIHKLKLRGHSVQIDDFGTGYSSLAYLRDLSVDALKIDRSFTQAIGTEAVTVGILPQILAMAQALGLTVIAEGIETAEQAAYFAALDVEILGQGWLFGHPVPAAQLLNALAAPVEQTTASL